MAKDRKRDGGMYGNTRANKAWKILKTMRVQNRDNAGISLITMKEWKEHYQVLLTEDRTQFLQQNYREEIDNDINIPPISSIEVHQAVKRMKNGKAPGLGILSVELIKAAPSILFEAIGKICDKCVREDMVPNEWKKAIITSIFKKGDRRNCNNYRGISVLPTLARIYGRILKERIEKQIVESEEQNGFRMGRSCTDGIFTLRNRMEKRAA